MRTLVLTLPPYDGGVPAKARWLCEYLRRRGHDLTLAYYATFGRESDLNVPLWRLAAGQGPRCRKGTCFDNVASVAVGCWLPELEFTYYRPSARWDHLIATHQRHIAVGGTTLISYPLARAGIPHLTWCASSTDGDRSDRVRAMPWTRRIFDRAFITPRLRAMERHVLSGPGAIYGVSRYTAKALRSEAARAPIGHLPIPVDIAALAPPAKSPRPGVVGFAGRLNDPRKNTPALIAAVARARARRRYPPGGGGGRTGRRIAGRGPRSRTCRIRGVSGRSRSQAPRAVLSRHRPIRDSVASGRTVHRWNRGHGLRRSRRVHALRRTRGLCPSRPNRGAGRGVRR